MRHSLCVAALFLAAIFTFQTFDIPPIRNALNPKTCCGRPVCLCTHAKGDPCPFRYEREQELQAREHCHLPGNKSNAVSSNDSHAGEQSIPKGINFAKGPCHSDASKSVLPEYSKDFLFSISPTDFYLKRLEFFSVSCFRAWPLIREQGIDHPPRIIQLLF